MLFEIFCYVFVVFKLGFLTGIFWKISDIEFLHLRVTICFPLNENKNKLEKNKKQDVEKMEKTLILKGNEQNQKPTQIHLQRKVFDVK